MKPPRIQHLRVFAHVQAMLAARVLRIPPTRRILPTFGNGWLAP